MTDSRIKQARRMCENGMSQTGIAEILGVGRTCSISTSDP